MSPGLSVAPAKMRAVKREGPFWDAVEGRAPLPAAAVTLGWELISASPEEGTIEVAFTASAKFLNPAGVIQGGFLAAMLDDTLGPALAAGLSPGDFAPTTDLHVPVSAARPPRSPDRTRTGRATRPRRRLPRGRAPGHGGRRCRRGNGDRADPQADARGLRPHSSRQKPRSRPGHRRHPRGKSATGPPGLLTAPAKRTPEACG
jgi:acyl-coenzyme A thioesterase PaaI-like protein